MYSTPFQCTANNKMLGGTEAAYLIVFSEVGVSYADHMNDDTTAFLKNVTWVYLIVFSVCVLYYFIILM